MQVEQSLDEGQTPMQMALAAAQQTIARESGVPVAKASETAQPEEEAAQTEETEQTEEQATEDEPKVEAKVRYKVKHKNEDGEDVEAELEPEELVKGYMLQKDYSRKTAQLARDREAAKAEARAEIQTKATELDTKLADAERVIWDSLPPEIPRTQEVWNKLSVDNPAEWARSYQYVQNVQSRITNIRSERHAIAAKAQQENQALTAKQAREAIEVLQNDIPGWSDDTYRGILKAAQSNYGFKAEEVGAITDPRAIKVLHDAMQFRAMKAKPVGEKKVVQAPKAVIKPGAPAEQASPKASERKQVVTQFQKTGSKQDAVALVSHLLQTGTL